MYPPHPEDAYHLARIRWMCNALENCAIQIFLARQKPEQGKPRKSEEELIPEIRGRADEISQILRRAYVELSRGGFPKQGEGDCPPGWDKEDDRCVPKLDDDRFFSIVGVPSSQLVDARDDVADRSFGPVTLASDGVCSEGR